MTQSLLEQEVEVGSFIITPDETLLTGRRLYLRAEVRAPIRMASIRTRSVAEALKNVPVKAVPPSDAIEDDLVDGEDTVSPAAEDILSRLARLQKASAKVPLIKSPVLGRRSKQQEAITSFSDDDLQEDKSLEAENSEVATGAVLQDHNVPDEPLDEEDNYDGAEEQPAQYVERVHAKPLRSAPIKPVPKARVVTAPTAPSNRVAPLPLRNVKVARSPPRSTTVRGSTHLRPVKTVLAASPPRRLSSRAKPVAAGLSSVDEENADNLSSSASVLTNDEEVDVSVSSGFSPATSFTTLPKVAISRIAKEVGVVSLAADVYDTVREMCGEFLIQVLTEVSTANPNKPLGFADIKGTLEKRMGRPIEDLEETHINNTTFTKFIRGLSQVHNFQLRNEAVLYLHNAIEFYLAVLFANARDLSQQLNRSRISAKTIALSSRMR